MIINAGCANNRGAHPEGIRYPAKAGTWPCDRVVMCVSDRSEAQGGFDSRQGRQHE